MNYAQLGWIDPQRAMAAIEAGTAEGLLDDARADEARQQREIQSMIGLRDDVPIQGNVPIAKNYDNHDVHLGVLHNWMKSKDYEQQPPYVHECAEAPRGAAPDAADARCRAAAADPELPGAAAGRDERCTASPVADAVAAFRHPFLTPRQPAEPRTRRTHPTDTRSRTGPHEGDTSP
jgi:hypothetical protein